MAMLTVNGTVPLSLPSVASATGGVQVGGIPEKGRRSSGRVLEPSVNPLGCHRQCPPLDTPRTFELVSPPASPTAQAPPLRRYTSSTVSPRDCPP